MKDDRCDTPAGFNVIFPGMLARGIGMGLEVPLAPADVDSILRLRDTELKRFVSVSPFHVLFCFVARGRGLRLFRILVALLSLSLNHHLPQLNSTQQDGFWK